MSHKILIVDDEPNIVVSLEFLMRREGHEVSIARDGQQGLDAIRELHPDLVLLDIMMPVRNGFDVLQNVRADPALAGTKIILLSAKGRDADATKGLALGADAYISKPFSTRELALRVQQLLSAPE